MLDNTENNAVTMRELESLLDKCETAVAINFDHLKYCVQCYAHIINICSSHVISSMTSVSKPYLFQLKVPIDLSCVFQNGSEYKLDDDNVDSGHDIDELELGDCHDDQGNSNLKSWFVGIKHNPRRHAHRVICLLHSLDQWRQNFCIFIQDGNK